LCLAAAAATAAWLVLGTPYRPRRPSAKGLFAALAFALPTAIGAIMVIMPEGARNAALAARLYTIAWLLTPLVVAALLLLLLRTMMAAR